MKTHIEYDDFGEYVEAYEDLMEVFSTPAEGIRKDCAGPKKSGNICPFRSGRGCRRIYHGAC